MSAVDRVLEASIADLCPQELAGAYRAICGMMLVQTAFAYRRRRCSRKDNAIERKTAEKWLESGCGTLTFDECCEALNFDSGRLRQAIEALAVRETEQPISRVGEGARHDGFPDAHRSSD